MSENQEQNEAPDLELRLHDAEEQAAEVDEELARLRDQKAALDKAMAELYDRQRHAAMHKRALEIEKEREEAERKRRAELERVIEIRTCDFNGMFVNVKVLPDIRSDVLTVLRSIYGRQFDGYSGVNRIPIEHWEDFKSRVAALPNVKVTHLLGVEGKISKFLTAPEFLIELKERTLQVTPHHKAITGSIQNIPGAQFSSEKKQYQIPLTEGWRLFDILESYTRQGEKREIVWQPEALKLVEEEVARRAKLDTVALKSDSDIDVQFKNGHALRPFQKVGVEFTDLADGRALIADQMGLGKTWQAIGYAVLRELRTVIVCPAHLKANWAREILQLTGEYPAILSGREPDKFAIEMMLITKPKFTIINYDILGAKVKTPEKITVDEKGFKHVVPPEDRWLWSDLINMSNPDLVVADEAHYIKNTDANRSKALRMLKPRHRIPMTGTPILNRPGEYWAILNWIRPELFPSEDKFISQYTNNGRSARNVEELRELLRTIMIRRLKKDVVAELPPINRITNLHELSDEARKAYQKVLQGVYRAIDAAGNQVERNVTNILVEIGKLKEVCAHDKVDAVAELATDLWDTELDATDDRLGNKKVLIFSQYKDVVRKIAARLGQEAIYWTGDTSFEERTRLEREFQTNPDVHFLVISLMTGQTGLNLTAAGHIIFADLYWTPAAHAQAEERAYGRLSNLHGAESYYLVAVNTVEEWIQELLQAKLGIINQVVEGIDAERDPSIGMEIINRLRAAMGRL